MSSQRLKINTPPVIHQLLDGEVIVVNLDSGTYYSLDGTAATIWEAIDRGASLGETIADAAARYDAPAAAVERAVTTFVDELRREELVVAEAANGAERPGPTRTNGAPAARVTFTEPVLNKYTDMQELLLLDPIHEVDESGWPNTPDGSTRAAGA
jgi:Coenzyme PQQ synthesis protein D (PqqD)